MLFFSYFFLQFPVLHFQIIDFCEISFLPSFYLAVPCLGVAGSRGSWGGGGRLTTTLTSTKSSLRIYTIYCLRILYMNACGFYTGLFADFIQYIYSIEIESDQLFIGTLHEILKIFVDGEEY